MRSPREFQAAQFAMLLTVSGEMEPDESIVCFRVSQEPVGPLLAARPRAPSAHYSRL
ncbi:hypothetical protein NOVOSPHI9U_420465 [Novosphingobium sp. 9U]|nr:hypothetical protein NOVOSPHI9U_420465 [Novosphingobium sp. 9U]